MLSSFLFQGAAVTQSYAQYISSTDVLIGSEIERLVALGLFSTLLAIGVKRAQDLLSEAAEKRISDIKMIESEKSSRVKTEFLATMSHELRTPLNGVLGMSEVLRRTELSETQESFVEVIEKSGQDLLSIIEDILDYTQLESEEMTRHIDEFELSAENITFIGDEFRLKRILINLLGNAIKFTEEGFVSLYITTTKTDAQSAVLSVYVQDSGIGIAEENFELIFEKFTQADNSKTRQYGGAGLGLSISQSLVRAEGGEIKLLSRLGQGSKFYFDITLPYKSQVPANLETTRSQYTKKIRLKCST